MPYQATFNYPTIRQWLCGAIVALAPSAAHAQIVAKEPCVPGIATVAQPMPKGAVEKSTVYAVCGDKAVALGYAERHEASVNPEASALVVTRWNAGVASIQLIFAALDGELHIDDLSREIAQQLGKGEAQDLSKITVALETFPTTGSITVTPVAAETTTATARGARTATATATQSVESKVSVKPVVVGLAAYRPRALAELAHPPVVLPTNPSER